MRQHRKNMMLAPGHWSIRPQLAQIAVSTAFDASRIYHINRGYNFRAHHQAKLALKIQNASLNYSTFYCDFSCSALGRNGGPHCAISKVQSGRTAEEEQSLCHRQPRADAAAAGEQEIALQRPTTKNFLLAGK